VSALDVAIVGGGISGLTTLHYVRSLHPEMSVNLYERDNRLGGTIGTDIVDGHSFDWGPNGFLDREPLTLELCDELGLNEDLERAGKKASKRFIVRGGRLREVPMSPPKFLSSDILSLKGRLRVMAEPFAPSRPENTDETIYDFAKRRIGREAADYLVQPMVSGVYGGMADRLSLKSCFKVMYEMESEYGSLIKAMIARMRKARKEGRKAGGPAGPGGRLTSFAGGLYRLIERFNELYSDYTTIGAPVKSIRRENDTYTLTGENGEPVAAAKQVVLATPSYRAAELSKPLNGALSQALAEIPYAPIAVVCLGFRAEDVGHPLDGFGFLVPAREQMNILGSIWTSSIFRDRSPDGQVQFRTMLGGDGNHAIADLSDDELINRTIDDLDRIVGLKAAPAVSRVFNWRRGIPQYVVGHQERLNRIEKALAAVPGLHLAGNAYYGIGLNDCVKQARHIADRL
jgi:oxygen-dependent protoporphyrinogen oxidase